jgi:uncharacterized membrane protein (DUF2068 family)
MDWSLLACGRGGHTTYAPDEPHLRAQLSAVAGEGELWRCLRCGTFVPGPPDASGPAAQAPFVARGRQIRSHVILKLFAVERILRAILAGLASWFLWQYRHSQQSIQRAFNRELPLLRTLFREVGFNVDHSKLVGVLRHALTLSSHALTLLAIAAALYAAIEVVEAVGLWLARRWGEYFAMVATSLGLPLEIYELSRSVTATASVLFAVNLALVVYLATTKRLFGIRGGKHAYEARLREESIMEAAAKAASRQAERARPGEGTDAAPRGGAPTADHPACAADRPAGKANGPAPATDHQASGGDPAQHPASADSPRVRG